MTLIDALLRLLPWLAFFLAAVIAANIIAGWRRTARRINRVIGAARG